MPLVPNPDCWICNGSGFAVFLDNDCRCLREEPEPDLVPDAISEVETEHLERALRGILITARSAGSAAKAHMIAILIQGSAGPSENELASFAGVSQDVASELRSRIAAALQPKKGISQCQ